jgi:hypothetical protein
VAKFVQIIEFETTKIDELRKLDEEWIAATAGKRKATRSMLCADREKKNRYFVIVEFPSYQAAMENSELSETQHFAGEQAKLADGEAKFLNLNLVEENDL